MEREDDEEEGGGTPREVVDEGRVEEEGRFWWEVVGLDIVGEG